MFPARVTLGRVPCKPSGIGHWQGGETSAPYAPDKPVNGQEAVHDCIRGRRTKNIPARPHSQARDTRRTHPARDGKLHDKQEFHARILSDLQDPGEAPHNLNKGPHHAGLSGEYEK